MNPMDLSKKRKADENGGAYSTPPSLSVTGDLNSILPPPQPSSLSPDDIAKILDPFTKEQLLPILRAAILRHPDVLENVRSVADSDPAQRKLFVRGLGWETNSEKLRSVFSSYGEIEEGIVINDKTTGKSKGYGFVTFKHIDGSILALKEPNKKIDGRITVTQLAAAGNSGNSQSSDIASRKIYVGGIPFEITSERLLSHFSMYGEIEEGPLGFDKQTGKPKGFAFFVYKTEEGARNSLVDPNKTIDGHQLLCKLATDNKKMKQQPQNAGPVGIAGMPNQGGMQGDGGYSGGYGGGYGYSGQPQHQPPQPAMQPPHMGSGVGVHGGYGQGGYGQHYVGSGAGDYAGGAGGPNMYRMPPPTSMGVQNPGGFPDGGNYGLSSSAYPSQPNQPGTGGPRAPLGSYQGMPPYYGGV